MDFEGYIFNKESPDCKTPKETDIDREKEGLKRLLFGKKLYEQYKQGSGNLNDPERLLSFCHGLFFEASKLIDPNKYGNFEAIIYLSAAKLDAARTSMNAQGIDQARDLLHKAQENPSFKTLNQAGNFNLSYAFEEVDKAVELLQHLDPEKLHQNPNLFECLTPTSFSPNFFIRWQESQRNNPKIEETSPEPLSLN